MTGFMVMEGEGGIMMMAAAEVAAGVAAVVGAIEEIPR